MQKLWAIATNAFLETIRQPIFLILLLVTFGILVLDLSLAGWTMDNESNGDNRMLIDLGLSTLLMSGLFVAAFSASGTLAREIEDRTVLTVVSKPVARPIVLLGKFLGVAAAVTVAFYLASLVFLMTVRHGVMTTVRDKFDLAVVCLGLGSFFLTMLLSLFCNYFFGWNFAGAAVGLGLILISTAAGIIGFVGNQWQVVPFGQGINPQILVVIVLLWMAVIVLTALAVAVSTRLGQMPTLGVCVAIFLLALVSHAMLGPHTDKNIMARLVYWAAPNLTYFFVLDALNLPGEQQQVLGGHYVALAGLYALCYSAALLLLGMALFQTREMDAQEKSSSAPGMVNFMAWLVRIAGLGQLMLGLILLADASRLDHLQLIGVCLGLGAALWLLAGYLGAGVRWALAALWCLVAIQLIGSVTLLIRWPGLLGPDQKVLLLAASGGLFLYVLAMSLRRTTRDHFARRRINLLAD